jgi:hypothetical protein
VVANDGLLKGGVAGLRRKLFGNLFLIRWVRPDRPSPRACMSTRDANPK